MSLNNKINTEKKQVSNLVQISNNNVKASEKMAEQYAKQAEKSVADCSQALASAQRCILECENIKNSFDSNVTEQINAHIEDYENPHQVTAEQVGAYTKTELDTMLANHTVDMEGYYTSSELDTKLSEKAGINLENTPFSTSGLYITQTVNETEWSRAYYSDAAKTTLVWLEQGGYYAYSSSVDTANLVTISIPLSIPYNHGNFTRNVSVAKGGFSCTVYPASSSDMGAVIEVDIYNHNTTSLSPNGVWWHTLGLPAAIPPDVGTNPDDGYYGGGEDGEDSSDRGDGDIWGDDSIW